MPAITSPVALGLGNDGRAADAKIEEIFPQLLACLGTLNKIHPNYGSELAAKMITSIQATRLENRNTSAFIPNEITDIDIPNAPDHATPDEMQNTGATFDMAHTIPHSTPSAVMGGQKKEPHGSRMAEPVKRKPILAQTPKDEEVTIPHSETAPASSRQESSTLYTQVERYTLEFLGAQPDGLTIDDLSELFTDMNIDLKRTTLAVYLRRMSHAGLVTTRARGMYTLSR
jgi:hypothetical protein